MDLLLTEPTSAQRRRRTHRGTDVRCQAAVETAISYLREKQINIIYDPASSALHAGTGEAAQTITLKAS